MSEPWFTPETYSMMPGLIVGLAAGAVYGVLPALLYGTKNFIRYLNIMNFIMVLICIGLIVFGIAAIFYDQPESVVYDFILTGVIALIISSVLWRFVIPAISKNYLKDLEYKELVEKGSSSSNDASDTEPK